MDSLREFYLFFFFRTPPDALFQLVKKQFFTGVSNNISLKIAKNFTKKLPQ